MTDPAFHTLRLERSADGHVLTVTLHRPEVLNAMNTAMGEELLACFRGPAAGADVRAVVFTGAGDRAFCVGADLKERDGMSDETWRAQHVIFEQAAMAILRCPAPVIAAVEGFALGGGWEMALLADFIVASESAVFALPEVTRGIFPGVGGTQLLPRIVGAPLAKELIFTGRRVEAAELAATIAENGPVAVRQAKKAIAWGGETDLETGMVLSIEAYNATVVTEDRLEGVRAFTERRKPRFRGR